MYIYHPEILLKFKQSRTKNVYTNKPSEKLRMLIDRKPFVKMSVLIHRFSAIPIKTVASYFVAIDKPMLEFIWRRKRCIIAKQC